MPRGSRHDSGGSKAVLLIVVPPLRDVEPMLRYGSTDSENPGRYFHMRVIVRAVDIWTTFEL